MKNVLCVILGGGQGSRLYPLTKYRSKPAVPLAGKFRLIDVPISNCLNSNMREIYILTQFNSESLNKHISRAYKLDGFARGFVEMMAAEQTMNTTDWFQGTADAVRRCLRHFNDPKIDYIIILSGDQLYKMDLKELMNFHIEQGSDITVSCCPVTEDKISGLGIMGTDGNKRLTRFVEKPQSVKDVAGMHIMRDGKKHYLGSMGIYCFNTKILRKVLTEDASIDFGRGIIPNAFNRYKTDAYIFEGYWSDIGTIESFYEANLDLAETVPVLNLYDKEWPYFTHPRYLSPAKMQDTHVDKTLISEGAIIEGATLTRSIIGLRSFIQKETEISESIIMGSDYYETEDEAKVKKLPQNVRLGIGKNCIIKRAILDKNVSIGNNVKIINKKKIDDYEGEFYCIKNGIVIIEKNAVIPPGTVI
ncbi:MAG: glucose-1-phosphate adenylyltransferase [Candidatus Omnitrophica bacterium]|nr:glucose-1-phosphate adenylyltransferase [Candidatus Omnitrophota bacterium]